tara:strand:+ start:6207 stop:8489 length:2283 start_codon:yes stop_codon:yes gene_type:complete
MNILEIEDMIKGLPDQALQREAQMPSGQVPQFLVVSEIQRRSDMRKRFQERQPQGTVKDQVVQEGIAAMAPPEPQMQAAMMGMQPPMSTGQPVMGMFEGGAVRMAVGQDVPFLSFEGRKGEPTPITSEEYENNPERLAYVDERMRYLQALKDQGVTMEDILAQLNNMYYNTAGETSLRSVATTPMSEVLPPNKQGVGTVIENIPLTDIVQPGNRAFDALQQVFGEPQMPAPTPFTQEMYDQNIGGFRSVVDSTPPAMRGARYPGIQTAQELVELSERQTNPPGTQASMREPSPAVGTFNAPLPENTALIQELKADPSTNLFSFLRDPSGRNVSDSPERAAMLRSMEIIERAKDDPTYGLKGTKSQIIARGRENPILSQINEGAAADDLARNRERMLASLEGTPLEGIYDSPLSQSPRVNMMELLEIAENQSSAVQTDGGRGLLTGSATDSEVVEAALTGDTSSSLSDRSTTVDEKDTNRTGTGGGKAVQGTGSAEGRLAGRVGEGSEFRELAQAGSIRRAGELSGRMSLAEMIENQERPTLSYQGLISDFEKQMESQLADIKREKGSQALIALGAGIARGDLGAGLSDAGKAAAASNAQKRALEARQQAMQMGLRKSEIDAAFQSEVQKQANKLEAQKTRISALESYGAKQDAAEQAVLNFENGIDTTLANIGIKRDYYDQLSKQQKATSRRAILNYVEGIITRQTMAGQDRQAQDAMRQQLLREAANILNVPVGELSGSTNEGNGEDQVIEFDDQGKRI